MNLSAPERVLVGIIHGEAETDFVMNVIVKDGEWSVTLASPDDGVLIGAAPTFDGAFSVACGAKAGPDYPGDGEHAPAPIGLRIVGGTEHPHQERAA